MAAVSFIYATWKAQYPMFDATVNETAATFAFSLAELVCDNSDASVITDPTQRTALLYMATAHVCQIYYGSTLSPASSLVGRVSDATEGSVSVSTDYGNQSASSAWWNQTKWGAMFWAATNRFRRGFYVPEPGRYLGTGAPFLPGQLWRR